MLSVEDLPLRQGVYVTNDRLEAWEGEVRWSLETLKGKVLASGAAPVKAAPQAATQVSVLDFAGQISDSCPWTAPRLCSATTTLVCRPGGQ